MKGGCAGRLTAAGAAAEEVAGSAQKPATGSRGTVRLKAKLTVEGPGEV